MPQLLPNLFHSTYILFFGVAIDPAVDGKRSQRIVIAHASRISIGNVLRTAGSIATALFFHRETRDSSVDRAKMGVV